MRAAGIAAGGIEGKAAYRFSLTHDIGDHGDHRRRHLGEIETRIGEFRLQRDRRLADVDDAHLPHDPEKWEPVFGKGHAANLWDEGNLGFLNHLAPLLHVRLDVSGEFLRAVGHHVETKRGAFLLHVR